MIVPKGTSEGCTGVGRARRDPDGVIVCIAKEARIGDAVERYTAGQTYIATLVTFRKRSNYVKAVSSIVDCSAKARSQ